MSENDNKKPLARIQPKRVKVRVKPDGTREIIEELPPAKPPDEMDLSGFSFSKAGTKSEAAPSNDNPEDNSTEKKSKDGRKLISKA